MQYDANTHLTGTQNHCALCGDEAVMLYEAERGLKVCGDCFSSGSVGDSPQPLNFDEPPIKHA